MVRILKITLYSDFILSYIILFCYLHSGFMVRILQQHTLQRLYPVSSRYTTTLTVENFLQVIQPDNGTFTALSSLIEEVSSQESEETTLLETTLLEGLSAYHMHVSSSSYDMQ